MQIQYENTKICQTFSPSSLSPSLSPAQKTCIEYMENNSRKRIEIFAILYTLKTMEERIKYTRDEGDGFMWHIHDKRFPAFRFVYIIRTSV